MNIKKEIKILHTTGISYICENCCNPTKRPILIRFEINLKAIRTYICKDCFKKLFKYINYKF